jgi:hypothetical protein
MNSAALIFVSLGQEAPAIVKNYMANIASEEEKRVVEDILSAKTDNR